MLVGDGTLYLQSARYDGDIVGLDPATGEDTWRSRMGKQYSQPRPVAAEGNHVYVVAGILDEEFRTLKNVIAAIDTTQGRVVWREKREKREKRDKGTEQNGITAQVVGGRLVHTDFRENLTVRDTATPRPAARSGRRTSAGPTTAVPSCTKASPSSPTGSGHVPTTTAAVTSSADTWRRAAGGSSPCTRRR